MQILQLLLKKVPSLSQKPPPKIEILSSLPLSPPSFQKFVRMLNPSASPDMTAVFQ